MTTTPFTFETPADGVAAAGEVSLALDRAGNPRIAFSQQGSGQITVAQRNNGTWTHENVPGGFVGSDSRAWLAIDSGGNPQLGFVDLHSSELIHAKKTGGQWSLTHIPTRLTPVHASNGIGGVHFSLRPSDDVAYFVYTDMATDGIGFAHTGNLGPTPVAVHVSSNDLATFGYPSASFDSSENFFVGYAKFFRTGGEEDGVSIIEKHLVGVQPVTFSAPVVVDDSPHLHVNRPTSIVRTALTGCLAYFDAASKSAKATIWDLGFTRIETVATEVNSVATPSAAANGDAFRIAFADFDTVKLASRDRFGTWRVEVVDPVSVESPSLVYDNARTAHIAYIKNGNLKYARRSE